jgi:hypothetical protein
MKIDVRPGVPFEVKTQDANGNDYQVGGTLRQMPQEVFQLNPGTIDRHSTGSSESSRPYVYLGKLGEGYGWAPVDGIVHDGESVLLTKK